MVINIKKIQLTEGNIGTNYKGFIEESRKYHLNIIMSDFLKNIFKVYTSTFTFKDPSIFQNQPWSLEYVWLNFVKKRNGAS